MNSSLIFGKMVSKWFHPWCLKCSPGSLMQKVANLLEISLYSQATAFNLNMTFLLCIYWECTLVWVIYILNKRNSFPLFSFYGLFSCCLIIHQSSKVPGLMGSSLAFKSSCCDVYFILNILREILDLILGLYQGNTPNFLYLLCHTLYSSLFFPSMNRS